MFVIQYLCIMMIHDHVCVGFGETHRNLSVLKAPMAPPATSHVCLSDGGLQVLLASALNGVV